MHRQRSTPAREDRARPPRDADRDTETQSGGSDRLRTLHRTVGNRAVQRLHERGELRAKLSVSDPASREVREADRVAEAVVSTSPDDRPHTPGGDRPGDDGTGRPAATQGGTATPGDEAAIRAGIGGSGTPLSGETRSFFESRMGADFSAVSVHTGPEADRAARSIDAEAFTVGSDVAFASGNYEPGTRSGKKLLAHELTHVVQQGAALPREGGQGAAGSTAEVQLAAAGTTRGSAGTTAGGGGTKTAGSGGTKATGGTETTAGGSSGGALADTIRQEPFDAEAVKTAVENAGADALEAVGKSPDLFVRLYRNLGSSEFDAVCRSFFTEYAYGPVRTDAIEAAMAPEDYHQMVYVAFQTASSAFLRKYVFRPNWDSLDALSGQLEESAFREMLDTLYWTDPGLTPKERIFEHRYGAVIGPGKGKTERSRKARGIVRKYLKQGQDLSFEEKSLDVIYRAFNRIPQRHLDRVDLGHMMGYEKETDTGVGLGGADDETGNYRLNEEARGGTDDATGANQLGSTAVHEFAHLLDEGGKYSSSSAFMSITGWEFIASPYRVVDMLKADTNPPHRDKLDERERKVADRAAKKAAARERKSVENMEQDVIDAYSETSGWGEYLTGRPDVAGSTLHSKLAPPSPDPLMANVAHGNTPGAFADQNLGGYWNLENHYYHQPYEGGRWVRYPQSAREHAISEYAFRGPGEEFAELYAAWQFADDPESEVPSVYHSWYRDNLGGSGANAEDSAAKSGGSTGGSGAGGLAGLPKKTRQQLVEMLRQLRG